MFPRTKPEAASRSVWLARLLACAETTMAERRQVDRLKTTSGALLFSSQQRGVFSCALRDISDTGVGLRLNDRDVIAPTFKITLDNFRNVQTCQLIWSRGRYVGALFDDSDQASPPKIERR
jgi:hypothetical protein